MWFYSAVDRCGVLVRLLLRDLALLHFFLVFRTRFTSLFCTHPSLSCPRSNPQALQLENERNEALLAQLAGREVIYGQIIQVRI